MGDLMRDAIVKNDNMRDAVVKDDLGLFKRKNQESDLMRDAVVKDLMRDAVVKNDEMRDAIVKDEMRDAIVKDLMRDAVVKNDLSRHEGHVEWAGTEDTHHYKPRKVTIKNHVHVDKTESCKEYGTCNHFAYTTATVHDLMRDAIVKDLMRDAIVK